MSEQKVKKREWVKTAAIIFLSVMLVLTFASNTFMNYTLPEVAVQYVQAGPINAKIRGTGTVTANESYEVKSTQSREVLSVPVKVGDKIEVGDTLVLYSEAESTQLKEVEAALDALILDYQTALIESGGGADYAKEKRAIELAQKELDKVKAERSANTYSAQALAEAKAAANRAKQDYTAQEKKVAELERQLGGMSPPQDNVNWGQVSAKRSELAAAQSVLDAVKTANNTEYDKLEGLAKAWLIKKGNSSLSQNEVDVHISALSQYLENNIPKDPATGEFKPEKKEISLPEASGAIKDEDAVPLVNAFKAIRAEKDKVAAIQSEIDMLMNAGSTGNWDYYTVKKKLEDAQKLLDELKTKQETADETFAELEEKKKNFEAADKLVDEKQLSLENLMFDLEQAKKDDGKQEAKETLTLADKRKQIDKKKAELNELKAGGTGASVDSKVNGIVTAISITAGNVAEANGTLMTIEVPDMGYGLSIPVTIEQSKRVSRGDTAEINYYYGSDLTATLVDIKTDPQNPTTNKLLSFKIQGEVESGAQLSLSIGERGQNYEALVPNSAVRSDNNGQFVLAVIVKDSPLGNRYIAQRMDVKVLATDDANSAVSGALTPNTDFVITTSTKPIEPGMQVRMVD